jgi:acetyl-CoA C-acetyltransferase
MSRNPVLIGYGTTSQREEDSTNALEPIALMLDAVRAAARQAGHPSVLKDVQRIYVPKGRWPYADPGRAIARAVKATRAKTVLSTVGVLQQTLIGDACSHIANGEIDMALVVGGDAGYRILRSRIAGIQESYSELEGEPDTVLSPEDELRHSAELRVGLRMPIGLYAIMESALRSKLGSSIENHNRKLATVYSRFSQIAAENPDSWSKSPFEPDAIRLPSDRNPMQAFPYTKRHCSSWNVDQAAALLLCSEEKARGFGLRPENWIYPWASTESNHMVPVVARSELERCYGAQRAGKAALQAFGLTIDNVDLIDLYSCFPVAVEIYAAELGISLDRDLTVTGGMPFAGGPYNNYVLQATCRMAHLLQRGSGRIGFISSVSGILTKQGFGLWSSEPPPTDFHFADLTDAVAQKSKPRRVLESYSGPACVVGYTVVYEPNTAPRAIAIADIESQCRVVAASEGPEVVARMQTEEFCGQMIGVNGASFTFQD